MYGTVRAKHRPFNGHQKYNKRDLPKKKIRFKIKTWTNRQWVNNFSYKTMKWRPRNKRKKLQKLAFHFLLLLYFGGMWMRSTDHARCQTWTALEHSHTHTRTRAHANGTARMLKLKQKTKMIEMKERHDADIDDACMANTPCAPYAPTRPPMDQFQWMLCVSVCMCVCVCPGWEWKEELRCAYVRTKICTFYLHTVLFMHALCVTACVSRPAIAIATAAARQLCKIIINITAPSVTFTTYCVF